MEKPTRRELQASTSSRSSGGIYCQTGACTVSWDASSVSLAASEGADGCSLEWQHVSAVWASTRARTSSGFRLEVCLEAKRGAADFLRFAAPMTTEVGEFLCFLQDVKPDKLKEDSSSPRLAMSRWATPLYSAGLSANRLRVLLGWWSLCWQVVFALCFLAQLEKIVVSREKKLTDQFTKLAEEFVQTFEDLWHSFQAEAELSLQWAGRLLAFGFPGLVGTAAWRLTKQSFDWLQLIVLFQHFLSFLHSLQGMWSLCNSVVRSAGTLHKAAVKSHKTLKKTVSGAAEPERCASKPKES